MSSSTLRSRWAAIGAAVAVCLGAGGVGISQATTSSGEMPVYISINPCRLADTRPAPDNVGPRTTPIGADEIYTLDGWGSSGDCTLPDKTSGLALNVTAVGPTNPTFLRLWPADGTQPTTSNLNPTPGQPPTPNMVNTGVSPTGEFNVFNRFGTVDVIIDVVGYYDDHHHDSRYLSIKQDSEAAIDVDDTAFTILTTDKTVATVTVETPTSGYVLANSSNYIYAGDGDVIARCEITQDKAIDKHLQNQTVHNAEYATIAGTRGFRVNKALMVSPDEMTINLVCDVVSGSAALIDPQLTAVFIPDPDAFGRIS